MIFNTVDQMKLAKLTVGTNITTLGYHIEGSMGKGSYVIADPADYMGDPDEFKDHTIANGNIAVLLIGGKLDPYQFGIKADGTDDSPPLQALINYSMSSGIMIDRVSAICSISTGLVANKGLTWLGGGNGSASDLSSVSNSGFILKAMTLGMTMLTISSGQQNTIVKNCNIDGISFDGDFKAHQGMVVETSYNGIFINLFASAMASDKAAFELNDNMGDISLFNIFENSHYNGTANINSINSCGFRFVSMNPIGGGCVQTKIRNCSSMVQDGDALYINGSDNNIFESFQTFIVGSGRGFVLANDGLGLHTAARNNQFIVPVGEMIAMTGTYGNTIFIVTSEVFKLTTEPNSQIHYEMFDYVESSMYETHKYKATGYFEFNCSGGAVVGSASIESSASFLWACVSCIGSGDGGVAFNMPQQYNFKNGKIVSVEITYTPESSESGKNILFGLQIKKGLSGQSIATPDVDVDFVAPVESLNYRVHTHTEMLGVNEIDMSGAIQPPLLLRVVRKGADAQDTYDGVLSILTIRLYFQYDGAINGQPVGVTLPYRDF